MNPFDPFIEKCGIVLLDGALATELERRGAVLDDALWSAKILLKSPELIRQVHLDYFIAGADVATSASYQATFSGFAKAGFTHEQTADLLRLSVQLAQEAREEFWANPVIRMGRIRPLVAASVGPYGAMLADGSEYAGNYGVTAQALMDFHRPRLEVLARAGADMLAFETIPCMMEAEVLVKLLEDFPDQQAWLSVSCRDDQTLSNGEPIEHAVRLANESPQIIAVGVNCTPPAYIEGLLERAAAISQKYLLVYPNSGERWDAAHKCWLPANEVKLPHLAARWKAAGARLIGGCCRTTPVDIAALNFLR